ncbi:MAG: hypothetical protein IJ632_03100 [Muribaculaceae bacterium]|nr:hypothetical protein [Muribaculaceae bacterium]
MIDDRQRHIINVGFIADIIILLGALALLYFANKGMIAERWMWAGLAFLVLAVISAGLWMFIKTQWDGNDTPDEPDNNDNEQP